MKFPPELLKRIRDSVNLIEVVGEHVVLRKTGANFVGLCPFHSERSPSFSVSEAKQLYHCYGCKKGGDLFSFVQEIHGIGFPEAVEELADRARVALPKDFGGAAAGSPEEEKKRAAHREKIATAHKLNRFVAAFYHQQLQKSPDVLRYLRSRGVNEDLQKAFYLGAASSDWDSLAKHLVDRKAPLPLATELGLVKASSKSAPRSGPGFFDLFRGRVMFPILDLRGKVAGFGGRIIPSVNSSSRQDVETTSVNESTGVKDGPKYLNSSESLIFSKGRLAYGLYQAQKHVREKDEVILVEGYFDVLALHAAGFENVVASCGTALTTDHLNIFRRFADRITLLFDGDKAGVAATDRAMILGLEQGIVLRGAVMPEGLDPDEILFDQKTGAAKKDGKERMQEILSQARPLLDVRMEEAVQEARQSPEARTQAIKQIGSWLASFSDPVGREVRFDWALKELGISSALLEKAVGKPIAQRPRVVAANAAANVAKSAPRMMELSASDRVLLSGLARGGDCPVVFSGISEKLPPQAAYSDLFDSGAVQELVRQLMNSDSSGGTFQLKPEFVKGLVLSPQVQSILTEAWMTDTQTSENSFAAMDFKIALERALGRVWARFSQRIKVALADAEAKKDAGLHSKLMKEYLDVQRKMKEFSSFYDEA